MPRTTQHRDRTQIVQSTYPFQDWARTHGRILQEIRTVGGTRMGPTPHKTEHLIRMPAPPHAPTPTGKQKPAWFEYLTNNKFGTTKLVMQLAQKALDKDNNGADHNTDRRLRLPHNPDGERLRSS